MNEGATNNPAEIELVEVSKRFGAASEPAVDRLSLSVGAGEFLVLLGESGCGKTTTLKMINRLLEPSSGEIRISGADILQEDPVLLRRRIGYVVQGIGLFPHLTVGENVGIVPTLMGWEQNKIRRRVDELLELMGLTPAEFIDRDTAELSGGQQQRVGVARALAGRPRIMLMDEPFGALDPLTRDKLQFEFKQLQRQLKLTVVMVTHDMMEAVLLADRIAVMRDGRLVEVGEPAALMRAAQEDYTDALLSAPKEQAEQLSRLMHGGGSDE